MSGARIDFGFIPIPREVVDDDRIDLSLNEWRLLAYLLRHRFRIKSERMNLKQDELLHGVRKANGERYDRGCRITSPRDLKAAREGLVEVGWVQVDVQADGSMVYEVCLSDPDDASAKCTQKAAESVPSANCTHPLPSAICTNGECNLFDSQVQNALPYKEEKVKKVKKDSSRATTASDGLHQRIVQLCKDHAERCGLVWAWDGSDGKALKAWIAAVTPANAEALADRCLKNLAASDRADTLSRGREYLPVLLKYQKGPLDQFGNLKGKNNAASQHSKARPGSTSPAIERRQISRGNIRAAYERRYGVGAHPSDGSDASSEAEPRAASWDAGYVPGGVGATGDEVWIGDLQGRVIEGQ